MYKMFILLRFRYQTWSGISSQTRPGISFCSLSGLSRQDRGQLLVLLSQSKQDQEPLFALVLDCLCQTGITPWSFSFPVHRTILLLLLRRSCWDHSLRLQPAQQACLQYIMVCWYYFLHYIVNYRSDYTIARSTCLFEHVLLNIMIYRSHCST